jgi:hypothetical protein
VVPERQESNRVHFHLVVVTEADIRSGASNSGIVDFGGFARRDYRSANSALRSEWAFWRKTAPRYGFGRTEILPIKSTAEGVARYVGSYISAAVRARFEGDKGRRLVRYLGFGLGDRTGSCRFGWANGKGWTWRRKVAQFAGQLHVGDLEGLSRVLGPRWAYVLMVKIVNDERSQWEGAGNLIMRLIDWKGKVNL